MDIKVLGTVCANCKSTIRSEAKGVGVTVSKVEAMEQWLAA